MKDSLNLVNISVHSLAAGQSHVLGKEGWPTASERRQSSVVMAATPFVLQEEALVHVCCFRLWQKSMLR